MMLFDNEIESWPTNKVFKSARGNTAVVNLVDGQAEYKVKLSFDFLKAAKSETHCLHIVLIMKEDQRCLPNLLKLI